ncbi:hypothetical protein BX261_7262 [Streptomyces sp. 2321.6]|uniref:hypothetical protein n=1 Tax=Streptomyces sp. 2321.6 TaxID=1938840 RepID=UPI000BB14230|nr:hypothetical protein [Streptomyces sp. 2321.6]PBC72388.1 hypothetical protein BX261_7262 [Streptomyces sp. 2321.6]
MHEPQPFTAPAVPLAQAPALYQPHALQQLPPHDVVLDEAADPRRALVQLEDGRWVVARVPPAPPVIVPAAPEAAAPRRPLSALERGAIIVVGGVCALTLSTGAALAMAGPYLADLASLAFGTAAVLGTGIAGWFALRIAGALTRATGTAAAATAPEPATPVVITGNGGQGGRFGSRGGTGVRIDKLTINR